MIETEVKLMASSAMLDALRTHPRLAGADDRATLVTTYFDTLDRRLHRGGASLRVRADGEAREQTLKLSPGGEAALRRGEWTVPLDGAAPAPCDFPAKARGRLGELLDGAAIAPVAVTTVERTSRRICPGRSVIEAAFDLGTIEAGGQRMEVRELELELVEGCAADVLTLAETLPLGPELRWSLRSKAERGHELAFDDPPRAVRAREPEFGADLDIAQGFQVIAWNCLGQLLANYPLIVEFADPDALHQSRVAIRRLRAALSLFGAFVADSQIGLLRAEIKAAAQGLGPARELDVLLERVSAETEAGGQRETELRSHLSMRREAATRSAQELLLGESFQRLLFQLAAWIEDGEWLKRKAETGADKPLVGQAARILARRRRKLGRHREPLRTMTDEERHELRIEGKKLRYAADFFDPLFAGKAVRKRKRDFSRAMGKLQDALGRLNDIAVAGAGRADLLDDLDPITAARLEAELDALFAGETTERRDLLKSAQRALSRVRDLPAWWDGTPQKAGR